MNKRLIIIAIIVFIWIAVALVLWQLVPERQARVEPTPTRTPKPTFTATTTATPTLLPSATPVPSDTPTATPLATNTPLATDTPVATDTPMVTDTLVPTVTPTSLPAATATRRPTPRPTRRPNTPTPAPTSPPPPPFSGSIIRGFANCSWTGVEGFVKTANGDPVPNISVGIWNDAWLGLVAPSEASGKYTLPLGGLPPGNFQVAVVQPETCGQEGGRLTAKDCAKLSNVVDIATTANCTGDNASQVTVIDFVRR
ncbi:MAG: hypothetical protein PVJ26_10920 [Anaerolineae bacterium]|jgi:hypothetical protein